MQYHTISANKAEFVLYRPVRSSFREDSFKTGRSMTTLSALEQLC